MNLNKFKIKYILLLIIIQIIFNYNFSYSQNDIFSEGEKLNYVVYYGFIKLGEVKMTLESKKTENGKTFYKAKSEMKSYEGIPFVSLNSIFESDMVYDGTEFYSVRFKTVEYKDEGNVVIEYKFNYDSNFVYVKKENKGKIEKDEKIKFNQNVKFQDGLSLFYKARLNSFSEENFLIPVFMNETETSVNYFFSSKKEEVTLSNFENDNKCVRCNGTANFEGVFGLTGEFAGWFSDDKARIPLKSQLNVLIGNITLELDSYKRNGWNLK